MQNINPLFILQPVIVIAVCSALMVYWYKKRRFHGMVWLYSLIAYGAAIALKYAVQLPTIGLVSGEGNIVLGVYYGVQTMFFEVGFAYLVAYLAYKRGGLDRRDAEAYGSGLGFWENVGLLSALSIVNLIAYYFILSSTSSLATTLYNQLSQSAPSLFVSNTEALGLVTAGTVERMSSLMIHVAWGYLCVMAVVYNNKKLFIIALPMGLIDFFVPFAGQIGIAPFEVIVFVIAAASVLVAWYSTKRYRIQSGANYAAPPPKNEGAQAAILPTGS